MEWIPLDTLNNVFHRYKIQIENLITQDNYWQTSSDVHEYYNLKYFKSMTYYFENIYTKELVLNGVMIDID